MKTLVTNTPHMLWSLITNAHCYYWYFLSHESYVDNTISVGSHQKDDTLRNSHFQAHNKIISGIAISVKRSPESSGFSIKFNQWQQSHKNSAY